MKFIEIYLSLHTVCRWSGPGMRGDLMPSRSIHGGQTIALLDEFDMVIVVTGDPFFLEHNANAWKYEKTAQEFGC